MSQLSKQTPVKSKKNSKDREKRKLLVANSDNNLTNSNEKLANESLSKKYASLCMENIKTAAGHITHPDLISNDSYELLAEDLNYKLRYIIHQASNRAFKSNRTVITSNDINETFVDLSIEKVYGAPSNPTWIPLNEQNILYLDDQLIDIQEEIVEEITYSQPADPVILKSWIPYEHNEVQKNYFETMAEAVVSTDIETRRMALQNISSNSNIGSIIEWFYQFGYILLSKDITINSLTLYALDLIETLEMCPIGNAGANEDQLKLLVRLILQRLLKSFTNLEILRPMCWTLAILCRRFPLREFVIMKLIQKLPEMSTEFSLPLLMIVNALGLDAIMVIFVKNMGFFVDHYIENSQPLYGYTIMETFNILYKNGKYEVDFREKFPELEDFMLMLYRPLKMKNDDRYKNDLDFLNMKKQLILTHRKLEPLKSKKKHKFEDVFGVSNFHQKSNTGHPYFEMNYAQRPKVIIYWMRSFSLKQKLENHRVRLESIDFKEQSYVEVGKTSFLLPIFTSKSFTSSKCCGHSLLSYNF